MMSKRFWAAAALTAGAFLWGAARNEAKIADVAAGKTAEARLAWWGFDAADSTAAFNEALASKATTIIIDKMDTPWILGPVSLRSNLTLIFEDGAEILAKKGAFLPLKESLITIASQKNVSIIGQGKKGGILRMHKADYQKPPYKWAEWRHTLNILSSENITVRNMSMIESGGDGIYIGVNDKDRGHFCKNVTISNCICDKNHRQGISVIACTNLLIENTRLTNTLGTPPESGIDFEPNGPDEPLINCVMRNCVSEGNHGAGYDFYLPNMDTKRSGRASITLENCSSRNERRPTFNFTTHDSKMRGHHWAGDITIKGCRFENSSGPGMAFNLDVPNDIAFTIKDTSIANSGVTFKNDSPLYIEYRNPAPEGQLTTTTFSFDNLSIKDSRNIPWLNVNDAAFCGIDNYKFSGDVKLNMNGKDESVPLSPGTIKAMFPTRNYASIKPFDNKSIKLAPSEMHGTAMPNIKMRSKGMFWAYAKAGENVTLTLHYAKLTRNSGKREKVTVTYPSGKKAVIGEVDFNTTKTLSFKAEEPGFCEIDMSAGNNWVSLDKCSAPCGVMQKDRTGIALIYTTGNLYFYVPEDAKNAVIRFMGQGSGEGCNVRINNPTGHLAWEGEDVATGFEFTFGDKPIPGIWELVLSNPTSISLEDFIIVTNGLPTYMATERALVPKP